MRVLVTDDSAAVRDSVGRHLREELPNSQVGEAANGTEALEACREHTWDAVVLDISMPGDNGLIVLGRLRRDWPGLVVVMFSNLVSAPVVQRCLGRGASGFVSKESGAEELVPAIYAGLAGHTYLCHVARAALAAAA